MAKTEAQKVEAHRRRRQLFSVLKKEIVHWRFYPTRESARQAIFEYIEVFYNRRRVQKRLGYLSPINFLNNLEQQYQQCVA